MELPPEAGYSHHKVGLLKKSLCTRDAPANGGGGCKKGHVEDWFRSSKIKFLLILPVVPHKAVAKSFKIGNLQERLVVLSQRCHSKNND